MKVKFFATYREITRCKDEEIIAPPDVYRLLENLGERYGAELKAKLFTPGGDEINEYTIVLVNGRDVFHMDGINTVLTEADAVSIFPVIAGG